MPSFAQSGPLIVDHLEVVEAQKRGAILWDIRSESDYRKGHIPGSVNIGDAGHVLRSPNTEDFIPTPQIERMLGAAGIDPTRVSTTGSKKRSGSVARTASLKRPDPLPLRRLGHRCASRCVCSFRCRADEAFSRRLKPIRRFEDAH